VVDCDYCEREFALCVSIAFSDIVQGEGLCERYQLDVGRVEMKLGGRLLDLRSQTKKTSADMSPGLAHRLFTLRLTVNSHKTSIALELLLLLVFLSTSWDLE
jgi:hypothetical protein